jgi:hypothetical protein
LVQAQPREAEKVVEVAGPGPSASRWVVGVPPAALVAVFIPCALDCGYVIDLATD